MKRLGLILLSVGCTYNHQYNNEDLSMSVDQDLATTHPTGDMAMTMEGDLAGGGGGDSATNPTDDQGGTMVDQATSHKRVFVTAGLFDGNLKGTSADGLAGGDKKCNDAAMAASIGGTWVAWLSDSGHNAIDHIAMDVGPWYRIDGMKVFDNKAAIPSGPLVPINITETGGAAMLLGLVPWTGTNADGTKNGTDCTGWTVNTGGSNNGETGLASSTTGTWTESAPHKCNIGYPLYCFEQ